MKSELYKLLTFLIWPMFAAILLAIIVIALIVGWVLIPFGTVYERDGELKWRLNGPTGKREI